MIKYRTVNKGKNVKILHQVIIKFPGNIYIGDNTYINGGMLVAGKNSKIIIGKNCLISYNINIRTTTHNFTQKDILIRDQGINEKDIFIGDDVWIGYGAQIMAGVKIGNGSVIAAGAIVTKDVEEFNVVGGIPAKVISKRV